MILFISSSRQTALSGFLVHFSDYFLSVSQESFSSIWCLLFQVLCCSPPLLAHWLLLFMYHLWETMSYGDLLNLLFSTFHSFLGCQFWVFLYILAAVFHTFILSSKWLPKYAAASSSILWRSALFIFQKRKKEKPKNTLFPTAHSSSLYRGCWILDTYSLT